MCACFYCEVTFVTTSITLLTCLLSYESTHHTLSWCLAHLSLFFKQRVLFNFMPNVYPHSTLWRFCANFYTTLFEIFMRVSGWKCCLQCHCLPHPLLTQRKVYAISNYSHLFKYVATLENIFVLVVIELQSVVTRSQWRFHPTSVGWWWSGTTSRVWSSRPDGTAASEKGSRGRRYLL